MSVVSFDDPEDPGESVADISNLEFAGLVGCELDDRRFSRRQPVGLSDPGKNADPINVLSNLRRHYELHGLAFLHDQLVGREFPRIDADLFEIDLRCSRSGFREIPPAKRPRARSRTCAARCMTSRYPAPEKLEIIRLVERSHLPVRRTLDKLGIPATTFYRWYDRYRAFGEAGLEDRTSGPGRIWNRIPDDVRRRIVDLALDEPELSPRELAVTFTDTKGYFVSEASVYRLLKAHDLITSPAFVVIKAADEFRDKTAAPNQLWQTDFTYLKVIGWGWFYLSTILDDFSRYIIAWKLWHHHGGLKMSPTRSSWPSKRQVAAARRSFTNPGSSATTARPTSPAILQPGLRIRVWITSAAHRTIPKPKARSSVGIRP